jgi:hypothetical protein
VPNFRKSILEGRLYLSTVVLAELYAGTRSREAAAFVDQIVGAADRIARLLTPTAGDWVTAGRLISRRIRLYGALAPRDHLADVLIVASTARLKGEVVSANLRHMAGWIDLAQRSGLDVSLAE